LGGPRVGVEAGLDGALAEGEGAARHMVVEEEELVARYAVMPLEGAGHPRIERVEQALDGEVDTRRHIAWSARHVRRAKKMNAEGAEAPRRTRRTVLLCVPCAPSAPSAFTDEPWHRARD
jgi:hypothetical protein